MALPDLPPGEALAFDTLVTPTANGIASRVLSRRAGGSLTLFAFDEGQTLSEHTSPYEALVQVLSGALVLTIGGQPVVASSGHLVRMPAGVPHAVEATAPTRMLLTMLRGTEAAASNAPPAEAS